MKNSDTLPVVLVVSADSFKSAFFKRTLKGLFTVIEASDSFTAVEWLKNVHATLIILDEKTLLDTWVLIVDHVRKLNDHVPLLLITNNLKKSFMVDALNKGITDFLNEPFDQDEVFQRILVATQSKPGTKKISMMVKKFKKAQAAPLGKLSSPHRFVITEDAMKEIAAVQKKHQSLCLLLLEVDNFQEIAHEIGEEGVQKLLFRLKQLCKDLEIILSQGSGRFLLLLPNTAHQDAIALAEILRKEVGEKPFHTRTHSLSLSLSIGVVALDKDDSFGSLLGKVDKTLNKAKRKGNRTVSE